jgi:hypothetical protein
MLAVVLPENQREGCLMRDMQDGELAISTERSYDGQIFYRTNGMVFSLSTRSFFSHPETCPLRLRILSPGEQVLLTVQENG